MKASPEKEILSFEAWCQAPGLDHHGNPAALEVRHAALQEEFGGPVCSLSDYKEYHYHCYLNRCGLNARDQVPYRQAAWASRPPPEGPKVLWSILHPRELAEQTLRAWDVFVPLPKNTGHIITLTPERKLELGSRIRFSKSAKKSTYGKPMWLLELLA
jgi:hypothetical protein